MLNFLSGYLSAFSFIYVNYTNGGENINRQRRKEDSYINEDIPFSSILVITDDGEKLGVLKLEDALKKASDKGLDLVVVNANSEPAVARMMDYSKFRYEQQRRQREMRKNQRVIQVKEVRLSPVIGDHDLMTKFNQAKKFIKDGDKIKITLRFRGRMIVHAKKGFDVIEKFISLFEDTVVVETKPKLEGRVINCVLAPNKKR